MCDALIFKCGTLSTPFNHVLAAGRTHAAQPDAFELILGVVFAIYALILHVESKQGVGDVI